MYCQLSYWMLRVVFFDKIVGAPQVSTYSFDNLLRNGWTKPLISNLLNYLCLFLLVPLSRFSAKYMHATLTMHISTKRKMTLTHHFTFVNTNILDVLNYHRWFSTSPACLWMVSVPFPWSDDITKISFLSFQWTHTLFPVFMNKDQLFCNLAVLNWTVNWPLFWRIVPQTCVFLSSRSFTRW